MWLERKSASDKVGSSITSPFLVLAEHAKSKLSLQQSQGRHFQSQLISEKLSLYIFMCVYANTLFLIYTHKFIFISHDIYFKTTSKWNTFPPFISFPFPYHSSVSGCLTCIWTPSCLACSAPWDFLVWSLVLIDRLTSYPFKTSVMTCVRSVTFFNLLLTPGRKGFCVLCLSNFGLVKTVYLNWKSWDVVMVNVKCGCICVIMVLTGGYVSLFSENYCLIVPVVRDPQELKPHVTTSYTEADGEAFGLLFLPVGLWSDTRWVDFCCLCSRESLSKATDFFLIWSSNPELILVHLIFLAMLWGLFRPSSSWWSCHELGAPSCDVKSTFIQVQQSSCVPVLF